MVNDENTFKEIQELVNKAIVRDTIDSDAVSKMSTKEILDQVTFLLFNSLTFRKALNELIVISNKEIEMCTILANLKSKLAKIEDDGK